MKRAHLPRDVMKAVIEKVPEGSGWQVAYTIRARGGNPPLLIGISGYYTRGADVVPPAELVKILALLRMPANAAPNIRSAR